MNRFSFNVMFGLAGAIVLGPVAATLAQDGHIPGHGVPPRAKPHRRSAAESFPPLPLPATPLRRSERKREPAPPALFAKMAYTDTVFALRNGKRVAQREWLNVTDDVANLMKWTNSKLGIRYRHFETDWRGFSFDPAEIPVIYWTGHQPIPELDDTRVAKLRAYLRDGGTIVANACCGNAAFRESFRREIARLFPRRECARLPEDHPIFSAYYKIGEVRYQIGRDKSFSDAPHIEGLNIGCRTAVFFAPIDLSNGWFGQQPPAEQVPDGAWIVGTDATQLGSNMVTYIIACHQYARMRATQTVFFQKGDPTRDQFVLAQVVHAGDWDPTPSALPSLLKFTQSNSTLQTQFKREEVSLAAVDVFEHPVLYMTGLRDFKLSPAEVERLRTYLTSGGVLVADAACGRASFDRAFRREIGRVLPKYTLATLPLEHPLYQAVFPVRQVGYTPLVTAETPGLRVPTLEGITHDGALCVIYSQYSLSNGWEQMPFPYNRGYADADALKIGVNIFVYAMTH